MMLKSAQPNLLIAVVVGLCGLCVYQWHTQTRQSDVNLSLQQQVYDHAAVIHSCTNTIRTLETERARMSSRLGGLDEEIKTNAEFVARQGREVERLRAANTGFTNTIANYRVAVATLQERLTNAYAGIQKANETIKDLLAQREDLAKRITDAMNDRNEVVSNYNLLVSRFEREQSAPAKR